MSILVRFAPSPTGFLHLGNTRTALLNWLFAKRNQGRFWLRLDDTDLQRSEARYTEAILEDLAWLGFSHDHFVRQSDRLERYDEAVQTLQAAGRLYPCYETSDELETKRKLQLTRGKPPVYDRESLRLTPEQRQAYESQGLTPHWRFKLEEGEVLWPDLVRGPVHTHTQHLSDPVLVREDGSCVYTLASVVDDLDMGVTHILRGEDHVTNTAVQIQLFQALGGHPEALTFGHFPLITDAEGQGFSKRLGSLSLQQLRAQGMHPLAISCVLASLGTSEAPTACHSLEDLVAQFDITHYGRATPKLSVEALWQMHTKLLHHLPYQAVEASLQQLALSHITPAFWEAFQRNLERLEEIETWWKLCHGPLSPPPQPEERAFLQQALGLLPPAPWGGETWGSWTQLLAVETGRKGRQLYHPLRLALTGLEKGPEMKMLLPWMAPAGVHARLRGETG
jgi:glutamyl-tRNA synthetase